VPALDSELETDRIVLEACDHIYYPLHRVDLLRLHADREVLRALGAWSVSSRFSPPATTATLHLTHSETWVTTLTIEYEEPTLSNPPVGYSSKPVAFHYFPEVTHRHPWLHLGLAPADLPVFSLTNQNDDAATPEDFAARDRVRLGGSDRSMALWAELLLNAGCSFNETLEYQLESDAGFRGVGPASSEMQILLPGWEG